MEVINPMSEKKFDAVCDVGVKLVEQLKHLLASMFLRWRLAG